MGFPKIASFQQIFYLPFHKLLFKADLFFKSIFFMNRFSSLVSWELPGDFLGASWGTSWRFPSLQSLQKAPRKPQEAKEGNPFMKKLLTYF